MVAQQVVVVPHDSGWLSAFAHARDEVAGVLGGNLVVLHHIGSTSVPGIYAKPIIDMMAEVKDLADVDACDAQMESLGYVVRGELGIPGRRFFFRNDASGKRTHQIHAFLSGSPHVGCHLAFRDYLRAHPEVAAGYSELKRRVAAANPDDIEAYMDGTDEFIKDVEAQAVAWAAGGNASTQ